MPAAVIKRWEAPLDPQDIKDYLSDFSEEMTATQDTIIGSTFTLSSAAQAAGVQIHIQSHNASGGTVFLKVDSASQGSNDWNGSGTVHSVTHTVTTAAGRTLSKTVEFTVQNQ